MVKIDRISLEKEGLTKFFSPNEARILEILWENGRMTSASIQDLCPDLSLPCVAGTLDRLVKSGFVDRKVDEGSGRVRYIYYPTGDREQTGVQLSEKIFENLVETFGDCAVDALGKVRSKRRRT